MTVVPIRSVIRTTVVPISGVICPTVMRIANATGIGYRHDGSIRFSDKLTSSDFFQHFGNGTSTGSIGKIYRRNGKNIMISVTVICFLKVNNI